ncbi:MAG: hypothetical protein QM401_10725 [Bacillota bacterium]|nr:hypothetical protein [Bacillota bacterium]
MGRILGVTKYRLKESGFAFILLYGVSLVSAGVFITLAKLGQAPSSNLTAISALLIFFLGMLSFSDNFRFMVANGLTRKEYFLGLIFLGVILSLAISLLDGILNQIYAKFWDHVSLFEFLYRDDAFMPDVAWSFTFALLFYSLGLLIRLISYSQIKVVKILASLSPVLVTGVIMTLFFVKKGELVIKIKGSIFETFGLNAPGYPLNGVGCLLSLAALALVIAYLLLTQSDIR